MKFVYRLSQKYADQQWATTSKRLVSLEASEDIPDEQIPEVYRQAIVSYRYEEGSELHTPKRALYGNTFTLLDETGFIAEFDRPLTPIDIFVYILQEMPSKMATYQTKRQHELDEKARLQAEVTQRKLREQLKKDQIAEQRKAWIAAYGSERLKKCQAHGYSCSRLYWQERAQKEFPGWSLDYNESATYEDRSGPSLAALTLLEQLQQEHDGSEIKIVWLVTGPSSDPEGEDRDTELYVEALRLKPVGYEDALYKIL